MPVLTPQITLSANLESILAGAQAAGYLQITLCGYGTVMPAVPGTGMLADAGIPMLAGPQAPGVAITQLIYGNDVITPAGTFYCVAVLDANKNAIQSGQYRFTGGGTQDLSQAVQIVGPYGFLPSFLTLQDITATGTVPGSVYTAPGPVVMVFVNGVLQNPTLDYNAVSNLITLTYSTELGDTINALCVVH